MQSWEYQHQINWVIERAGHRGLHTMGLRGFFSVAGNSVIDLYRQRWGLILACGNS